MEHAEAGHTRPAAGTGYIVFGPACSPCRVAAPESALGLTC